MASAERSPQKSTDIRQRPRNTRPSVALARDLTILAAAGLSSYGLWNRGESIPSPKPLPAQIVDAAQGHEDRTNKIARQEADRTASSLRDPYDTHATTVPPELKPIYRRYAEKEARAQDPEGAAAAEAVADHKDRVDQQNNKRIPWRRGALAAALVGPLGVFFSRREWPTIRKDEKA